MLISRTKLFAIASLFAGLLIAAAVLLLAKPGGSTADQPADSSQSSQRFHDSSAEVAASLPFFKRLNPGYIRGSQPAKGGLSVLQKLGVKAVVDLRSSYDHSSDIGEAARMAGLNYYWVPTSVWDPPSDEVTNRFISIVTDSANLPVYVFCADGLNRVGEMSAVYRIANDDFTVDEALKELDESGFNPYYWSLRNYVWTWARKFKPSAVPADARRISPGED